MLNKERDLYLEGLSSSLMVQLAVRLNNDAIVKLAPVAEDETLNHTVEDARVWIAGYHAGNALANKIATALGH